MVGPVKKHFVEAVGVFLIPLLTVGTYSSGHVINHLHMNSWECACTHACDRAFSVHMLVCLFIASTQYLSNFLITEIV